MNSHPGPGQDQGYQGDGVEVREELGASHPTREEDSLRGDWEQPGAWSCLPNDPVFFSPSS